MAEHDASFHLAYAINKVALELLTLAFHFCFFRF
ncbi:hypothetical protein CA13_26310 [Planctomycetes bacterium CA13]|uniref:Uncharacterized protein n=1 Tax=Novipirellula herctigrandis TaxID=2527986 RepID=A0A5C5Z3R1_9BACT|nr:hypothetical protein CA13_26310 [Planctomycetes bacterium CA13]